MLGAIIGDMVGSIYEFHPIKSKDFDISNIKMSITDDSALTLAVGKVLLSHLPIDYSKEGLEKIKKDLIQEFVKTVNEYPNLGYGTMFYHWARMAHNRNIVEPYNSCGNGAAMRISPVGWIASSLEEVKTLSKAVTEITHNHPEGIKGAEAVATCVFLARNGKTKEEIRDYVIENYYPEIKDFDFDTLVNTYEFDETCQNSCPQAIYCFLISDSLEDAVRNCVAVGGDCDTTGAMAGAIAEAYYQRDEISPLERDFFNRLDNEDLQKLIKEFYCKIESKKQF